MWGWLPGRVLSGSLNGSGPAGGLPLRKGWAADRVSWVCSRGWLVCPVIGVGDTPVMLLLPACVGSGAWWVLGWGWLPGAGIGDTPAVVGCWGCCGRGGLLWWVPLRGVGVACCRGSGAVRPGCLTCLGLLVVGVLGWVWVGWL